MDTRKDENELHLLGGSTVYKQDYAPEVLPGIYKPLSDHRPAGLCNHLHRLYSRYKNGGK